MEETKRKCQYPGCTSKQTATFAGKTACLQHVEKILSVQDRRRLIGLNPVVPPNGFMYIPKEVKFKDVQDDKNYKVDLVCGDCGYLLNQSHPMAGSQIKQRWVMIVMGSALNAGSCPKGCRATFSDCNINTKLKIYEIEIDETKPISI